MAENETYRSRWTTCDECETNLIVERDDNRGVPDETDWDAFPDCPVCGATLGSHYNADEHTQRELALRQGERRVARLRAEVAAWVSTIRDLMAQHKEFDGRAIDLIDETGLHFPLADEIDDLAVRVAPPGPDGVRDEH